LVAIAPQPLYNVMVQAIHFFDIVKFLWAARDNFSWFESAVLEKKRYSLFALIDEQALYALPGGRSIARVF
jgi:hypothetical protein